MQPNSSRPVMDVAKRPSTPQRRTTTVRPAPALSVSQPMARSEPKLPPTAQLPTEPKKDVRPSAAKSATAPTIQAKPGAPVGIIVMALLVMMVLIGLAVVIYLTS